MTNNEAEYEALIARIELAKTLGANRFVARIDSQLVANQVNGIYPVKDNLLAKYHDVIKRLFKSFANVSNE